MGEILHGSATTTVAMRRAIQHGQESLRALARRYGVNPKTVAKWNRLTSAADPPPDPFAAAPLSAAAWDRAADGKLYLFVAIDRTSRFAFVQLAESANRVTASSSGTPHGTPTARPLAP